MLGYFGQGYFGEYGVDVITQATPSSSVMTYEMEADWDGNGFNGVDSSLTSRLLNYQCKRGRGEPNALTSLADPADFTAIVDNRDGKFSTFNVASSLYGDVNPNVRIRFRISAPIAVNRFTGYIQNIEATYIGAVAVAMITAKGALHQILETKVNPPASAGAPTGSLINTTLDEAGWPTALRDIDAGQSTTSRWYEADIFAIDACRNLESTELGFLLDDEDGNIAFQDRNYRLSGARQTSQATYSDTPGASYPYLRGMKQLNPLPYIRNSALITVPSYSVAGLAVLWTLQETPSLSPGQTISRFANYPNPNSEAGATYVDAWTTPVVGTDITQSGVADSDLVVTVYKFAKAMKITITNTHATNTAVLTLVQARGTGVIAADKTTVSSDDLASQDEFGLRTHRLTAPWVADTNLAQDLADAIVLQNKDPHPAFMVPFLANMTVLLFSELMGRRISDRVSFVGQQSLTALGVASDCFVESIEDNLDVQTNRFEVTLGLSPAGVGGFWIVGTSTLGVDTFFGF